jgi:hypothetical protein
MSELEARLAALEHRVGELEDLSAIRRLHWAYGYYIDFNRAEDVVQLFADDGVVVFLSGEYHGHAGVRRLYGTWFQNFFTQGVNGPVDGFLLDHFQMQDIITVAADRRTAKGRFRGLLMGGCHETRPYKPEGLPLQFYEAGIYENDYVRADGVWKIKRLDYMMQWGGLRRAGQNRAPPAAGHADLSGNPQGRTCCPRGRYADSRTGICPCTLRIRASGHARWSADRGPATQRGWPTRGAGAARALLPAEFFAG